MAECAFLRATESDGRPVFETIERRQSDGHKIKSSIIETGRLAKMKALREDRAVTTARRATARFIDKALILGAAVIFLCLFNLHREAPITGGASHFTVQCGAGPVVAVAQSARLACP